MLLCVDIGNTNIVLGIFDGVKMINEWRLETNLRRTSDEYCMLMRALFQHTQVGNNLNQAIISSVVPPLTAVIAEGIKVLFGIRALIVGPGIKTGLALKVKEPTTVGADRVVNSVAVRELYGKPALVVDFGTATTFDYVGPDGAYEGGVIAPGMRVSLEALVLNTAKLPRIELRWPEKVVGKDTVSAMQAGIMCGYVAMVDGLVQSIVAEVGALKHIVATGGLGEMCVQHSKYVKVYDGQLTLRGMQILAALNNDN